MKHKEEIEGLANRLKILRTNAGYSRRKAADFIGISESMIGLYETSERQPSLSTLVKLASLYKVTTDYILGCETLEKYNVSVVGLTEQQKDLINLTIQCFRNPNN